jgi:hypothetical protein
MRLKENCGNCNICDYRGYDECPQKVVPILDPDMPFYEELKALQDAVNASGKCPNRVGRQFKGWQR